MTQALIIDDNPLNIDVLVALLEHQDVNVAAIELPRHLEQALEELNDLHIIFLDLEFPNNDGFDLLQDLKTYPQLRQVPIVAYSVHTSEIDKARKAGFHSFIGKPLDVRRFPDQLARILRGEPVWEI